MRFRDPVTGEDLLSYGETDAALREEAVARRNAESRAEAAESRVEQEAAARRTAEARIAQLEALIRRRT